MNYLDELADQMMTKPKGVTFTVWDFMLCFWRAISEIAEFGRNLRQDVNQIQARFLLVDVLPDSAVLGAMIRVRGDVTGTIYFGNGNNQPITKISPTVVS